MAPLPANNTDRYFLDYEVGGVSHEMIMRVANGTIASVASSAFSDFIGQIATGMWASSVQGMRLQVHASSFSIPATYSGSVTTWGSGAPGDGGTPAFCGFSGRGGDGRKVSVHLYGFKSIGTIGDYRFAASASEDFQNALNLLQAAEGVWLTIGGTQPTWHSYVNIGFNAYWQRKMRTN